MSLVRPPCGYQAQHTEPPASYREWVGWGTQMARTHWQWQCPGCSLYVVWVQKGTACPLPWWWGHDAPGDVLREKHRRRWRKKTAAAS